MDEFGVRDDFPVLGELTYLNTASAGLVPQSVLRAAHDLDADIAGRGTTGFDEAAETGVFDRTRRAAARLVNAEPHQIAVATSFTEALCQLAWSIRPGAGRNVVSTDVDFPSVTYPWFRVGEETGMEVRLVPVLADPRNLTVDRVAELVDDATAVVCISHVQYLTGHRLDLAELARLAHEHGALLVADATQSAGQVPIDVTAADVDVLIAGSYKWLCSTFGAAVCYLAPRVLADFDPPFVGWRSTVDPYALDARWRRQPFPDTAARLEYSTMSYASAVALGAAIEYTTALGPERILEHNAGLAARLMGELTDRGATLLTPTAEGSYAGTVTARFPGRDGARVAAELTARGVIVSPRVDSTRFSMHFYNTEDDLDAALRALDEVLAR